MGVIICGMNGSGKSTLGRALAESLGWRFIDNEDLYFPKADPAHPFAVERTQDEVERLLLEEVRRDERFVFAAVRGNYGDAVCSTTRRPCWWRCRGRSVCSACGSDPIGGSASACCPAVTCTNRRSASTT